MGGKLSVEVEGATEPLLEVQRRASGTCQSRFKTGKEETKLSWLRSRIRLLWPLAASGAKLSAEDLPRRARNAEARTAFRNEGRCEGQRSGLCVESVSGWRG